MRTLFFLENRTQFRIFLLKNLQISNIFCNFVPIFVDMRKRFIISFLLVAMVMPLMAVRTDELHTTFVTDKSYIPTHCVTITFGGGFQPTLARTTNYAKAISGVRNNLGGGFQLEATYTYYIHKYVGVVGGFNFEMNTGSMGGSYFDRPYLFDKANNLYYYLNSDYDKAFENHQIYMFDIPVGAASRINITDPLSFRASAGLALRIMAGSHYRASGKLTTSADYPDYNLHLDPDLPQHNLTERYLGGFQGKVANLRPVNLMVWADAGMHYQFNKRWGIYAGIYFTYTCLNALDNWANTNPTSTGEVLMFDGKKLDYFGMLNSKLVDALNPLSVGVKVGVTITYLDPIKCSCKDI